MIRTQDISIVFRTSDIETTNEFAVNQILLGPTLRMKASKLQPVESLRYE
ncbi:MAG: hypothetical protein ACOCZL_02290 [Bacteroidota bacterium]